MLRRRASAAARHMLWTCATIGALLLPLLGGVVPVIPVRLAVEGVPMSAHRSASEVAITNPIADVAGTEKGVSHFSTSPAISTTDDSQVATNSVNWSAALLIVYLAGCGLAFLRLIVEQLVVRALVRGASPVVDGPWAASLSTTARRMKVTRRVQLLRTPASILPLTARIVHPIVLIPNDADTWSDERRDAVLLHELAHVRRQDCLTQTIAAVACTLYWPHPLAWWAAARLRVERELACDDAVIARGIGAHDYARHLLEIARSLRPPRPTPTLAVGMAASEQLESRIRAAVDDTRRRGAVGARVATAAAVAMFAVVAPLSAIVSVGQATMIAPPVVAQPTVAAVRTESIPVVPPRTAAPPPTAAIQANAAPARVGERMTFRGGEFNVRLTTRPEGPYRAGMVHFSLITPGLNTFYVGVERLDGLTLDQLRSRSADLRFSLRRDAGTLRFSGAMRGEQGSGRFEFIPDSSYATALIRRGIGRLTSEQHFSIGLHDVPLAFLDELAAQGYATPRSDEVVRAGMSSVDLDFVREMGALGYRVGSLSALIQLSNVGVDPQFIRQLAAAGQTGLSISELRRLRVSGDVDRETGRVAPTNEDSPLNGRWTITTRSDGWLKLDIEWADVNQWSRMISPSELSGLSMSDVVAPVQTRFAFRYEQDAGRFDFDGELGRGRGSGQFMFAPNRGFASTLRDIGVREVEQLSNHDLKNLGFAGVSAAVTREFISLGLGPLTRDQLLDLAVRQVTPAYVRALQAAGVQGADSLRTVVELRFHNFPAAYARDMGALGYKSVPSHLLVAMYRAGVTPDFVRKLRDAGERDLTPEQLIELRQQGRRR